MIKLSTSFMRRVPASRQRLPLNLEKRGLQATQVHMHNTCLTVRHACIRPRLENVETGKKNSQESCLEVIRFVLLTG